MAHLQAFAARGMMQRNRHRYSSARCVLIALALVLLAGCEDDTLRQYRVPAEDAPTSTRPLGEVAEQSESSARLRITYQVPEAWRRTGETNMRLAGFIAGKADDPVEITVTAFAGDVGGVEANVRRWARQVGAAAPDDEQITALVRPFDALEGATAADVTGPDGRIFVVFVERGGATWFFKMTGSRGAVKEQLDSLRRFVSSARFDEGGPNEQAP